MIIVFGSINMDLIFRPELAPQAGETVLLANYLALPGGKGANQAVAASRMGSKVQMAACVGQDGFGDNMLQNLSVEKVDTSLISRSLQAKTGTAIITVDASGENRIMVAAGGNLEAKASSIPQDLFQKGNSLLMQMETDIDQIDLLAAKAIGKVDRVILNLAPARNISKATLKNLDVLILNEIEIAQLSKDLGFEGMSLNQATTKIAKDFNLLCVVTLGARGAFAVAPDRNIYRAAALPIEKVLDSTGAGDAFCGTFAAALDQKYNLQDALSMACIAGSLACLKIGATSSYPYLEDVTKYMASGKFPSTNMNGPA